MFNFFKTLLNARLAERDEQGASAVEYGLLIAGIAAVVVVVALLLGPVVASQFSDTCSKIDPSATCTG